MKYFDENTIEKIRRGYYTAVYFNRTKEILRREGNLEAATMQIFQKKEGSILGGVVEVRELLNMATGYFEGESWINKSGELEVRSLADGDRLDSWETVMHISGPYAYFAHLESLYLGILARRTLVATNTRKCVEAAGKTPIIFFGDRFDYFLNQEGDGYAAKIGGASAICTEAMEQGFGKEAVGTIPHALIALNKGDTVKAAELFHKYYADINLIALVDFDNDCAGTSLAVARKLGKKLWGVRLDTAGEIIDKSIQNRHSDQAKRVEESLANARKLKQVERSLDFARDDAKKARDDIRGVNPRLVRLVRNALDKEGFGYVRIVVSGGFYPEKIKIFSREKVAVDAYGVGSAIIAGENDFTADIVKVEGKEIAKVGREYKENMRLRKLL